MILTQALGPAILGFSACTIFDAKVQPASVLTTLEEICECECLIPGLKGKKITLSVDCFVALKRI